MRYLIIICLTFNTIFSFSQQWQDVGGGLNGEVRDMFIYENNLLLLGDFDYVGNDSTEQIAFWDGNSWTGYTGTGIGYIYDMVINNDSLFACDSTAVYYWNGSSWNLYIQLNDNIDGKLFSYQNKLFVATNDENFVYKLYYKNSENTIDTVMFDGGLYAHCIYQNRLYLGGCFTSVYTGDGSVYSPHLVSFDGTSWYSVDSTGSTANILVLALAVYNNELYVGGSFDDMMSQWNNLLKWDGSNIVSLIDEPDQAVQELKVFDSKLYAFGDFNNIGSYNTGSFAVYDDTSWQKAADFNGYIYSMIEYNNEFYIAGNFSSIDSVPVNNIAVLKSDSYIENEENNLQVNIYPNPFSKSCKIEIESNTIGENYSILVFNSTGTKVREINNIESATYNFQRKNLPSGIYFYKVKSNNKALTSGKLVID